MKQTIWYSLNEQFVNTFLGLILGVVFLVTIINPVFGLSLSVFSSIEVSLIMFVVSMLRGLILRRIFYYFNAQQSFKQSVVEKFIDVGIGFVIATITWSFFVIPSYSQSTTFSEDVLINVLFFVLNFVRSVVVRRFYELRSRQVLTSQS